MTSDAEFLTKKFGKQDEEVLAEWSSIRQTFNLTSETLLAKWEAHDMSMGNNSNTLSHASLQDLQKSLQRALERSVGNSGSGSAASTPVPKQRITPRVTPRSLHSPASGILGSLLPMKRAAQESPTKQVKTPRVSFGSPTKLESPHAKPPSSATPLKSSIKQPAIFSRSGKGKVVEVLNDHLDEITESSNQPDLRVNVDVKKFNYKTMYQKLSDIAEYLDEQIETITAAVQEAHDIEPSEFGNPATISQTEIVVVGRILPESPIDDKLSTVHLQAGRRVGAGSRVPLRFPEHLECFFYPGQIVAVRGSNASGSYFAVTEILDIPLLPPAASPMDVLTKYTLNTASNGLKIMTVAGPYTYQTDLDFAPLEYLISLINDHIKPSAVILLGPFVDVSHPMVVEGNFTVRNPRTGLADESATLDGLFKYAISERIKRIHSDISVIMIPHVRDAAASHAAFPQPPLSRRDLGLPKNVHCLPNPATFSLNEVVISASSQDVIFDIARTSVLINSKESKIGASMGALLGQRSLYPLFPGCTETSKVGSSFEITTGSMLDVPYMGLAEFNKALPDIVISPSRMKSMAQITSNVIMVNPGFASRRESPGEYAIFSIHPYESETQQVDEDYVTNDVYKRARVEIVKV
ncbi:uncharacterized protein SAPINGB_P006121 [Magnusiomyces paraingens]|uniref:DNA polymerase alpha subunit B n=1 Tax=Magnusiomyces paraingens TaxID=2606893 RepID=A0A5E8C8I6_9ASCO|nr:uncharacterized protein SAPINGB_P006121 [Saprochaete ingens]VVT58268.1 unnamed protein product [Saprochaete ingens]